MGSEATLYMSFGDEVLYLVIGHCPFIFLVRSGYYASASASAISVLC